MAKQSREDLKRHLAEQINFLKRSSAAYDQGFKEEAKRLAVVIRVLVHDTQQSKSLMSQLLLNFDFWDTSINVESPEFLDKVMGLVNIDLGGGEYSPRLGNLPPYIRPKLISFNTWWNKVVIVDNNQNKFTRKDLVLNLANKEGGAHVDPELDNAYAELAREYSDGWRGKFGDGPEFPVEAIVLASVRQIAYEVIVSLEKARWTA